MEKQSNIIDKITKNIIKEGGLHQPSPNFLSNVMEAIDVQEVIEPIAYKPLISKKIWIALTFFTGVIVTLLFLFPVYTETSLSSQLLIPEEYKFTFPELHLSKITVYGIGFLSLFLFQIPFLKRQLNNSY